MRLQSGAAIDTIGEIKEEGDGMQKEKMARSIKIKSERYRIPYLLGEIEIFQGYGPYLCLGSAEEKQ